MVLADFLPASDHTQVHSIRVQADPHRCFSAVKDLTLSELSPLVHLWLAIRAVPWRLRGRAGRAPLVATEPMLEQILSRGLIQLAEADDREIGWGTVGRFWQLAGGSCPGIDRPPAFLAFNQPGSAKAVMNCSVDASSDGGTRVSTETRIQMTDAVARSKFAMYWRVVHPGSALIRQLWLMAVKRRAEYG